METLTREDRAERIAESMPILKTAEGYQVPSERDPDEHYSITKTNGRVRCTCPDFLKNQDELAFECKHIRAAKIAYHKGLIRISKNETAQILEYRFRADQIKTKNGMSYVEGAAVIQRLNDAFGYNGWSFEVVSQETIEDEIITRGRLTVFGPARQVVKEQIGTHSFSRAKDSNEILSRGDCQKASATDSLKKCASLLGIGLHLYSRNDQYLSFQAA